MQSLPSHSPAPHDFAEAAVLEAPTPETPILKAPWLDFLWLELTHKCNLECVHCYTDSSPTRALHGGLMEADWRRTIDQAAGLGCRKLQFIGGEPTLHPALPDLIRFARDSGFDWIEVYTNGLAFSPRLRAAFVDHRVALAFSIYAATSLPHDAVTRRAGSHTRTIANLRWALAAGLDVRTGIIATGLNPEVTATRRFLQQLGVRSINIDSTRAMGRGGAAAEVSTAANSTAALCGRCWEGKLCITADGQAMPCTFARQFTVGHITAGLDSVLRGAPLQQFRHRLRAERGARGSGGHAFSPMAECGPVTPNCVPLGDPCSPEEFHPCLPMGGRPCVPQEGPCTPEVPPCGPEGGCNPNAPPY
ncbi:radical SAM protein [Bradyrhizobium prioriisuperbiae]|uniref:radical SAM protein n=1 Tax=Bradyrhizobium prioriisuperbiae TaxID=2854389 RepID=UPI0028E7171F|nr:radical SAM protein [Bradyrhizobium prioritasuperba]